jgi:hypothetical protein
MASKADAAAGTQRKPTKIDIQLPRYNLHDALAKLTKQTGIEVIAGAYAKPRPRVAGANMAGKPFRLQASSVEKALDQLCAVFDYEWSKDGKVYLLHKKYPHLDELYQVSNEARQKVDALPKAVTFKHLTQFLDIPQEWVEALAEQHPTFILLSQNNPRRDEIAFYARLPETFRAQLDKGEKVAYSELPIALRQEIQTTTKARWKSITTEQVSKFAYRLTTDPQGWQRLQVLNLPGKLSPLKKSR